MGVQFSIENQSDEKVALYLSGITPRIVVEVHKALKAWIYTGANISVSKYFAAGQSVARGSKNTGDILISRTGTLRRSITASISQGMTPRDPSPETKSIQAVWGAATPYARIQEYGGYAGRGHRSYIPPRPYLSRALRDIKDQLILDIQTAIDKAITA